MSRLNILLGTASMTIALEEPAALTSRLWGIVSLRLVDELTGQPPRSPINVTTTHKYLWPRVAEDGLIGLVGIPQQAFPALQSTSYTIDMAISVQGYLAQEQSIRIPSDPAFPTRFTPLHQPDLALHRLPIVIKGRTVLASGYTTTPLSGATVRVTGMWRTPPPANVAMPATPPNLICLDPPVYAAHEAISSHLQGRELPSIAGDDKLLLDHRPCGSHTIRLNNRMNLTTGDILLIDAASPDRCEWLLVRDVVGGSTPDQETQVIFEYPMAYEHRRYTLVQRVAAQPLGPSNQLTAAAQPGDTTVFLDGLNGLNSAHPARLSEGSAAEEYHAISKYITMSNSDGFYRLPPISRVAQLELEVADGIHTPKKLIVSPNYEEAENIVDLVLR